MGRRYKENKHQMGVLDKRKSFYNQNYTARGLLRKYHLLFTLLTLHTGENFKVFIKRSNGAVVKLPEGGFDQLTTSIINYSKFSWFSHTILVNRRVGRPKRQRLKFLTRLKSVNHISNICIRVRISNSSNQSKVWSVRRV